MLNKNTQVQVREICDGCTQGVVYSPVWEEYWRTWDKKRESFIEKQTSENWSSSKINYEFDLWEKANPSPECPEEDICAECEGAKVILKWVSLEEFRESII